MILTVILTTALAQAPANRTEVFHGRLFVSNGTPSVRILRIGTNRILGVHPDESPEALPGNIRKWVKFGVNVYADFTVEYIDPIHPNRMALVRLVSAKNVVIEQTDSPEGPKVFKLPAHAP